MGKRKDMDAILEATKDAVILMVIVAVLMKVLEKKEI